MCMGDRGNRRKGYIKAKGKMVYSKRLEEWKGGRKEGEEKRRRERREGGMKRGIETTEYTQISHHRR